MAESAEAAELPPIRAGGAGRAALAGRRSVTALERQWLRCPLTIGNWPGQLTDNLSDVA